MRLDQQWAFASISPGLEEALLDELGEIGIQGQLQPGGVRFKADGINAVHLYSRLAGRVSLTVGTFPASNLAMLAGGIRKLAWRYLVWPRQKIEVKFSSTGSKLKRSDAVARKVENSIKDALRGPRIPGRPPTTPAVIRIHIDRNQVRVSLDASGELLHRRGWRKATAKAPLRENLAAAMLRIADWSPDESLVDPMCGAGTFAIEAACIAAGRPPGAWRRFACEAWPVHDKQHWRELQEEARKPDPLAQALIWASDRDPGAIKATRSNAERARVLPKIEVVQASFGDLEAPEPRGLLVINPPYGQRVQGKPPQVFGHLGDVLKRNWKGWRFAILVPGPRYVGALRLGAEIATDFDNGGIPVVIALGEVS
jgi:putative N6-adenine-specific DNA methylase